MSDNEQGASSERTNPNILITGTPGTGKSTLAELASEATGLYYINVGELVKEKGLHEGFDQEFQSYILDDDKVIDELEQVVSKGGNIIEFHSCDLFPERWFDLVLVLRTDNTILYNRLEKRGYSQKKITENIDCEIFQVILEEARESYSNEIVVELQSNTIQDMESNASRIEQWVDNFKTKK
ncbi:1704_t:CDS:2 [Funneliformis geosporum]|uniref:Adenylate kinase isoenzyme 6 homolog n=1 Tax=Funneliformis geosporum TaxID=1117311 RepID=A0A9W4WMC5_9GLOM|nr:11236_t:CDS:2 [Funneliformis geosporum]CAI2168333.1 1704_t:CDS:2 [Funneliformis geosporum]